MLAAFIASDSEVVGSNPDPWCQRKGYELNKVEFEGADLPLASENGCFTA
jgi:hypothetical protein